MQIYTSISKSKTDDPYKIFANRVYKQYTLFPTVIDKKTSHCTTLKNDKTNKDSKDNDLTRAKEMKIPKFRMPEEFERMAKIIIPTSFEMSKIKSNGMASSPKDNTWFMDYNILKSCYVAGKGDYPNLPSRLRFHIVGQMVDGRVFQDEVADIIVCRDMLLLHKLSTLTLEFKYQTYGPLGPSTSYSPGLLHVLSYMKTGETSTLVMLPKYGYGSKGSMELCVPPNSILFYKVTLLEFTNIK